MRSETEVDEPPGGRWVMPDTPGRFRSGAIPNIIAVTGVLTTAATVCSVTAAVEGAVAPAWSHAAGTDVTWLTLMFWFWAGAVDGEAG